MHPCCNRQAHSRAYIVIGPVRFHALYCAYCGEVATDLHWWEKPLWWLLWPFWNGRVMVREGERRG